MKFFILFIFFFLVSCETLDNKGDLSAQDLLKKAEKLSSRSAYIEAVETLSKLKYLHPYSDLSSQADLLKADILFKQSEWTQAEKSYRSFQALYPSHPQKEYAQFRQVMSLNNQISKVATKDISLSGRALKMIAVFNKNFPKSKYKEEVLKIKNDLYNKQAEKEYKVASFYFQKKKYQASLNRLDKVLNSYPKSAWFNPAVEMGIKASSLLKNDSLKQKYLKRRQEN